MGSATLRYHEAIEKEQNTELTLGKIEFEYSTDAVAQFFKEKRRDDLKRIKETLESFDIDSKIIDAVIKKLKDS